MKILDIRTGKEESGQIVELSWNYTVGHERVVVSLDTGFRIELSVKELNRIRPQGAAKESDLITLLDDYGEKLKQRRKAKNLSLVQLARASGLNLSAIARIERKDRTPGIDTVLKIERALEAKSEQTTSR